MIVIEDKDIDDDCLNEIDEQSRALMNSLGADYGSFPIEKQEAPEILQVYVSVLLSSPLPKLVVWLAHK